MLVVDPRPQVLQSTSYLGLPNIGPADLILQIEQDLGNPAHSDTPDPNEMDMVYFGFSIHRSPRRDTSL